MSDTEYYGIIPDDYQEIENRYRYSVLLGQTFFPAVYTIGAVDVYYNGVHLDPTEFDATDGQTVVIPDASFGASVVIVSRRQTKTYQGTDIDTNVLPTPTGTTIVKLKTEVVLTADLPAAGADQNGRVLIEDAGAGDRNLIIYAGGQRFRIDGGAPF